MTTASGDAPAGEWTAWWIDAGETSLERDVLCRFRREVTVTDPETWRSVRVSADSVYRLWVNGRHAARGPERGTLAHRVYDVLDLSGFVRAGQTVAVAAEVLRWGIGGPSFDLSARPAFLLQGGDLVSDSGFRARVVPGFNPRGAPDFPRVVYVAGNWMEHRDAREDEPGWRDAGFDDARWAPARELFRASDPAAPWRLFPRALPPLLEEPLATPPVVQAGLVEPAADAPPFGYAVLPSDVGTGVATLPLELPGDGRVHYVVLDVGRVTNAFVSLELDAPAGATVELMYAESPSLNADKAHRGILDGRRIEGYRDEYVARSGRQCLEPHTRRTFRFLRVAVRSLAGAVTLLRLDLLRTGFPFEELGSFACSDASLDCVWQVGWDTCRLCAHDTYEDSPYYEQLQYVGDARIQALISYVVAGEHRLAEKALVQLAETRDASGFLMARQPARERVVIPGFSLLWIEMLEELHLFTGREELARELLPLTRELLAVFRRHEDPDGCLRDVPMWNFLDWSFEEKGTLQRPGDPCAPITMFYVGALRAAARLHARLGSGEHAAELAARGARTARAVRRGTWSAREGAFFDGVARRSLSRHTNALGLLYGIVDGEPAHRLAERVLSDTRMKPTTFYFDFYVHRAFERLGRADLLLADMDRWRAMLELGATAWFETHGESRSDCHAWSASPTYDLLRAVLGVRVVEPGYAKVRIEPHPGGLGWARGRVATPRGPIEVEWRRGRDFELDVSVPDGVEAEVVRPVLGR